MTPQQIADSLFFCRNAQMTPQQIAKAQELARNWKPKK